VRRVEVPRLANRRAQHAAATRNPTGKHSHSRARLVVTSKVRTEAKANGRWNGAVRLVARPTVRARDRCVLATGVYSLQVCTHYRCVLATGVYSRQVCTHDRCVLDRCVLTTGVYSRQVCTHDRCVLTTVLIRPVHWSSTVQPIHAVVPLKSKVAPLFSYVNAISKVLTTMRTAPGCTPTQTQCCRARPGSRLLLTQSRVFTVSCP